jgi:cyclophilin family peptidyl-prolyl cis-trans isomerase
VAVAVDHTVSVSAKGLLLLAVAACGGPQAYNFYALCTGERGTGVVDRTPLSYRGCAFHRIVSGMMVQGGDIVCGDGAGGESVYGGEFADESFELAHDAAGVLSSANTGQNTNQSQFFVTLAPYPSLDGENVAFGKVVEGMDVIHAIAEVPTDDEDAPVEGVSVTITDCGALP